MKAVNFDLLDINVGPQKAVILYKMSVQFIAALHSTRHHPRYGT